MDWQTRRKLAYAFALFIATTAITIFLFRNIIFPTPTCFDKKQNGFEVGIDCGGVCTLRCSSEVAPLTTLWSRALKISSSTYDLVAMISNKNIDNASQGISYKFNIYNAKGVLIQEIIGKTLAPVDGDFPVIKQSVKINEEPKEVTLEIEDSPHYKVNEKPTSPTLRILNERYEAGGVPRVYVTIMNTKRITINNLQVRTVLFDQYNNAYAVGETLIPRLDKEQVKEISFTWNSPLSYSPTRIKVYPIFDPFLSAE